MERRVDARVQHTRYFVMKTAKTLAGSNSAEFDNFLAQNASCAIIRGIAAEMLFGSDAQWATQAAYKLFELLTRDFDLEVGTRCKTEINMMAHWADDVCNDIWEHCDMVDFQPISAHVRQAIRNQGTKY